ncbi:hypothetical protein [Streptomyces sp. NPDC058108]|uniref:hypothetical protein n=1 Tax=Streptomyces sp. NPDC058108 TaxID=3346344 RepID=UPI0036E3B874
MTAIAAESSPLAELPPMPATATPVILPGLLGGLGLTDYQQSIDSGLTESFEDFCKRISKES